MSSYHEIRYEGFGPGGIAIIIEAITDNRNRTASDIRSTFSKHNGNLGEINSVSYQFKHLGAIDYLCDSAKIDQLFEIAVNAGAEDVTSQKDVHTVLCTKLDFVHVRDVLFQRFGDPLSAQLVWQPQNTVSVNPEDQTVLFKLLSVLDDHDDVQHIFTNYETGQNH